MMKSRVAIFAMLGLLVLGWHTQAGAAQYPDKRINGFEWFYIFGSEGNPYYGAEHQTRVFMVQVPKGSSESVTITIVDADTRGAADEMLQGWDTSTKFSVFAGQQLLKSETVPIEAADGTRVIFGPFAPSQGEPQGNSIAFRVEITGVQGNDNNLYAIDVQPNAAEFIGINPGLRLSTAEGDIMRLFPSVPVGTTSITAWNYDLDVAGGRIHLMAPRTSGWGSILRWSYGIKNSASAGWASTHLHVDAEDAGQRWTYRITKGVQNRANMSVRIEDQDGNMLPIHFTPGDAKPVVRRATAPAPKPVLACNTFEFDATKSYDPDNDQLSYAWNFGDGTTANAPRIAHTYGTSGTYDVLLTVTDNSTAECRQSNTRQQLLVNMPPRAALDAPQAACAGSTISLSARKSSDSPEDTLTYTWDLGDGTTAEGAEVTHRYANGGDYPVRVTVNDNRGTSCSQDVASSVVRVNSRPLAHVNKAVSLCATGDAPFAVSFSAAGSKDPEGDQLSYRWDFGDGSSKTGKNVTHTYTRGGNYTARVTIDDGTGTTCAIQTAEVPVKLNHAPQVITARDVTACAGQLVTLDATQSTDADGDALSYAWDFGDGQTGTGARVTHRYAEGGTFHVTVTANDGSNMSCATSSTRLHARINSSPLAIAKSEPSACVGRAHRFDATDSSDPDGQRLSYRWNFGDGTSAEGARVEHTYDQGGNFPITLTVDDGSGSSCSMAIAKGNVRVNTPPQANAGANIACCQDKINSFNASGSTDADGDRLTYRWDFGDGTTADGQEVTHAYRKNGSYQVLLSVNDNSGSACSVSSAGFVAGVNGPPVAQMAIRGVDGVVPATAGE